MDLHGAQGSGGRIGLVNLAGIGSPTWSSALVGFLGSVSTAPADGEAAFPMPMSFIVIGGRYRDG
jgi:hypothetical protein